MPPGGVHPITTAVWRDGKLTIHEGTQSSGPLRAAVARELHLDPSVVEVRSPDVGGAFGQKGAIQRQTAIIARAAMLTGGRSCRPDPASLDGTR